MNMLNRLVSIALTLLVSSWPQLVAANQACQQAAEVVEIAPGVFVRAGHSGTIFEDRDIANIGFVVGKRCVAVIDTGGSQQEGEALLRAVKRKTSTPVCYVINTHVHPDHILGNLAFKSPDTRFIGHHNLRRAMSLLGPTYLRRASNKQDGSLSPDLIVSPEEQVQKQLELDLGGRVLQLTSQPQAHTDNDLTVFDVETRTLWLADLLFSKHIPVIGGSGSLNAWLKLVKKLQKQPAERAVPGHGPASLPWPEAANDEIRYLSRLRDDTRVWLQQNGELPEALENIGYAEKGKWEQFSEFHKRNVSTAYTELEWE